METAQLQGPNLASHQSVSSNNLASRNFPENAFLLRFFAYID